MRKLIVFFVLVLCCCAALPAQKAGSWRAAKPEELEAVLPARAPVEKERIETEMRTATGIVNDHGRVVAAVVLITAGYAADGKYSHYFMVQSPITVADRPLAPGNYVVGWKHAEDGLSVHIFDANTGVERLSVLARPQPNLHRIESFRIFPPGDRSVIQIGRYILPYSLPE